MEAEVTLALLPPPAPSQPLACQPTAPHPGSAPTWCSRLRGCAPRTPPARAAAPPGPRRRAATGGSGTSAARPALGRATRSGGKRAGGLFSCRQQARPSPHPRPQRLAQSLQAQVAARLGGRRAHATLWLPVHIDASDTPRMHTHTNCCCPPLASHTRNAAAASCCHPSPTRTARACLVNLFEVRRPRLARRRHAGKVAGAQRRLARRGARRLHPHPLPQRRRHAWEEGGARWRPRFFANHDSLGARVCVDLDSYTHPGGSGP
jgi:hypothetical protein